MSTQLKELLSLCKDLKLIYVEDEPSIREATKEFLENFFTDIVVAVDGQDAIEKFALGSFDLLISDINMPRLNGLDMLKIIRQTDTLIPVLMLSANSDSKYFIQAIDLDIDGYLLKPIMNGQFTKALHKITTKINLMRLSNHYKQELELEVQKRNEEITHTLHFDDLTKLGSRYSFFKEIKKLITPVILLIDLDKFKIINEVYGTNIGSKVLKKFSEHLVKALEDESYELYRLSADEFAILDSSIYIDTDKYEELIGLLFEKLNHVKLEIAEHIITVDITIGLSTVSENSYESAKIALDYAKKHKKPFTMYSSAIDYRKESSLTLKCRDDIVSAIDDKRVVAVYQPIVDRDGKIVKYETLMRLQEQETLKLMSPFYFLDVAIKTRLYEHLSSSIIFQALNLIKTTHKTLSVNFTYSDIKNSDFIRSVEEFLIDNKDVGSRVIFEITETESIENYDDVKNFIYTFKNYGVKIAIDDFGSGFSNFEYILEIEPDYLKIDGSLIKDIDKSEKAHTLVEAIVQFTHKLGIKTIAEYVHSEKIFLMLKELNVDEFQGYYFSEPLETIN